MAIRLDGDSIEFHFPEVDDAARMRVSFQRTARVPDDGHEYGLPAGFGRFPLRRVADLMRAPRSWQRSGGVVMPMWQSEACWLTFDVEDGYPFLVTVGCGGVNAVTGGTWSPEPDFESEDYFEVPEQPWLDGFCVGSGVVRQFVAMPLDSAYTVEQQVTGEASVGGIQIAVVPLKSEVYRERYAARAEPDFGIGMALPCASAADSMGLAAGGSIAQSIATPVEPQNNWESTSGSSLTVHIANSAVWAEVTGSEPPTLPLSAAEYTEMGVPWFTWYDDTLARAGSATLSKVASVFDLGRERREQPLPENESFDPPEPVVLGPRVQA
ncbi:hypothetical protein [Mycolicibacterium sp.]|uniref:hypothetical protein n=1 Tax=Mycolicibacterium sp. TaxID=2320850 RepID=UPI001A1FDE80|nr:hypothetical protein [Mycolicibacterium sp.]MBJ7338389.1 hypothetical protein [Mycolicibacterium sp.]